MITALMVLIFVVVVFLVGYPLIQPEQGRRTELDLFEDELLAKDKEAVLSTINEIEFDYKMGKLAQDDYEILKEKYKIMALKILKEEDEEALEEDFRGSKRKQAKLEADIEQEIEQDLAEIKVDMQEDR